MSSTDRMTRDEMLDAVIRESPILQQFKADAAAKIEAQVKAVAALLAAANARNEKEKPALRAKAEKAEAEAAAAFRAYDSKVESANQSRRAVMYTTTDAEIARLRAELRQMADPRIQVFRDEMSALGDRLRLKSPGSREMANFTAGQIAAASAAYRKAEDFIYEPPADLQAALDALRDNIPGAIPEPAPA